MTTADELPRSQAPRAVAALGLVTVVWGWTFVWMKQAIEAAERVLGPDHLAAGVGVHLLLRFGVGALILLAVVPRSRAITRDAWTGGLLLGGLLWAGFALQMAGLDRVTPAVSAFLTSLYVLFTALLQALRERRGLHASLVVGALLATAGAALIRDPRALDDGGSTFAGEALTVACALVFAVHILATDRVTRRVPPMPVTVVSLAVVALGGAAILATDAVGVDALMHLCAEPTFWQPVLLSAVLSTALAISLMNVFQRELDPVRAAILYALEPIWAACVGIALGTDAFTPWLLVGGGLLFAGNVVAELGLRRAETQSETAA